MLVSIGSYQFCDGTLPNGVAVGQLKIQTDNVTDTAIPIGAVLPALFDRAIQSCNVTFIVRRTHPSVVLAEIFILQLDQNIPAVGTVTISTTAFSRVIPNGRCLSHSLLEQDGATTTHQYTIVGGPPE